MEAPLVDAAVAEEGHGHLARAAVGGRERRAGRDAAARGDDAVRAEHAEREVRDVHRAAAAAAHAGGLPVELGHQPVEADALGDRVAVPAVGRRDVVVATQRGADTGGDGLLADVDVDEAGQLAGEEELLHALLEQADPHHRPVQVEHRVGGRERGHWAV